MIGGCRGNYFPFPRRHGEGSALSGLQVRDADPRADGTGKEKARDRRARSARAELARAYAAGFRACAIACLHGWTFPAHEQRIGAIAREIGFLQITISSDVSGLAKFILRADTTVADAYLSPVLDAYVDRIAGAVA